MEKKTKFVDYIKILKESYVKKAGFEEDNKTFDYIIDNYSKNIHRDIVNNMMRLDITFDNFIKYIKIDKENYDLNILFSRNPNDDEIIRCAACINNLEFDFKVNYKAIWVENDNEGNKLLKFCKIEIDVK